MAAIWPDTKMNEKIKKLNDWAKIIIFQNGIRFANNIFIGPKIQNHLHLKMKTKNISLLVSIFLDLCQAAPVLVGMADRWQGLSAVLVQNQDFG